MKDQITLSDIANSDIYEVDVVVEERKILCTQELPFGGHENLCLVTQVTAERTYDFELLAEENLSDPDGLNIEEMDLLAAKSEIRLLVGDLVNPADLANVITHLDGAEIPFQICFHSPGDYSRVQEEPDIITH